MSWSETAKAELRFIDALGMALCCFYVTPQGELSKKQVNALVSHLKQESSFLNHASMMRAIVVFFKVFQKNPREFGEGYSILAHEFLQKIEAGID